MSGERLYIVKLLILFAITFNTEFAEGDPPKELVPVILPASPSYGKAVRTNDLSSVIPLTFFTRWQNPYDDSRFEIIDSQYIRDIKVCDTNCFAFTTVDEQTTYLVIVRLSPTIHYDTIFSLPNSHPQNWLNHFAYLFFSLRDSMFSGRFQNVDYGDFEVKQLVKRDSLVLIRTIDQSLEHSMSRDFSLLFYDCYEGSYQQVFTRNNKRYVMVYDIQSDSLFRLASATSQARNASSSGGKIFYIGDNSEESNLWVLKPDGSSEQLTHVIPPEKVLSYTLYSNRINVETGVEGGKRSPKAIQLSY